MTAFASLGWAFVSRRTSVLLLILGLHALLIYGFATGLAQRVIQVIPPTIQSSFEQVAPTHEPPPPLPPPTFTQPHETIALHELTLAETSEENTIHEVEPEHSATPPTVAMKAPIRVLGGPGNGFPNTDDYYPPASIRLGEEGSASVRVCVDDKGRLAAAPTIADSSGSERLDEGALKLARAGSGHYRATLEDGQPVSSCYAFRVRFVMKN
jgi:protein TonB